jgi:hypothetical protein
MCYRSANFILYLYNIVFVFFINNNLGGRGILEGVGAYTIVFIKKILTQCVLNTIQES